MKLTDRPSAAFERQIERIHQLLEGEPSHVTWDDKIPDPDNPDQLRQIDIRSSATGAIIHVECRIHLSPQDVTWRGCSYYSKVPSTSFRGKEVLSYRDAGARQTQA